MRRLTHWLAKTALGIGCAIGILLGPSVAPALGSRTSRMDPPQCSVPPSLPQEMKDWVAVQCAVHAAIFADDTEPSTSYIFQTGITQPGTYPGVNHTGREVSFEAAFVIAADFKTDEPDLHERGIEASMVIGRLIGPAGAIPIHGTLLLPVTITNDSGYLLLTSATMTTQELGLFATSSRILAGPRVTDTATGDSFPLSELQSAQWLSVYASDLATLYCGCAAVTSFGPGGSVDPACVKLAYDAYNIAVRAAQRTAEGCMIAAIARFVVCMAICTGASLVPGIGWIVTVMCALGCLAIQVIDMAECVFTLNTALAAAQAQLQLALAACGVQVVGD